ncbi:MAG: STAS domain-containing protein [Solirubrobacteraceae bacterium]
MTGVEIQSRVEAHDVVVKVRGELDLASAPQLERELREVEDSDPSRIVLDLSELAFMDASGISLVIRALRSADANGHRLAVRPGPANVQRVFALAGLVDQLTFVPEV